MGVMGVTGVTPYYYIRYNAYYYIRYNGLLLFISISNSKFQFQIFKFSNFQFQISNSIFQNVGFSNSNSNFQNDTQDFVRDRSGTDDTDVVPVF